MKQNALILFFIAGLCLVMMISAEMPAGTADINKTGIPGPSDNTTAITPTMTQSNTSAEQYVRGELLVRFNPAAFPNGNALNAVPMQAHATIGAVMIEEYRDMPGLELVRLPPAMSVQDGIAFYSAIPTVMYAEPNAIYSIANSPDQGNATQNPPPAGNTTDIGDVFVKYNATAFATPADLQEYANVTNAAINASVITDYTTYGMPGLQLIGLDTNMTSAQGIAYYQNVTHVVYAEPNVQYTAVAVNQTVNPPQGKP